MYDGGVFLYMKAYYSVDAEQYSNQFEVKNGHGGGERLNYDKRSRCLKKLICNLR